MLAQLGRDIRQRRRALGLTQSALGSPLTRSYVSSIEHGRCLPSVPVLALFAHRLHVTTDDLLGTVKHELAALYTADRDAPSLDGPADS